MDAVSRTEVAGEYLLEESLTPEKAATLTYVAAELGEGHEMYDEIKGEVEAYLEATDDLLKGSSTGEEIEIGELREILNRRGENFYQACESAFEEVTDSDRELIEETQKAYLHSVMGDLVHNGEELEIFRN